jgi:hypothetical protein
MEEMRGRDAYDLARETSVRVIQNSLDQRIPLMEQIKFLRFFRFGIVFSYCIIKFIWQQITGTPSGQYTALAVSHAAAVDHPSERTSVLGFGL